GAGYRSGGQNDVGPVDLGGGSVVAVNANAVVGQEGTRPGEDGNAPSLHQPGQPLEQLVDHLLLATLTYGEVDNGRRIGAGPAVHPELRRPGHRPEHRSRLQELLGWDTAPVEAGVTHLVELDDGGGQIRQRAIQCGG